MTTVQRLIFPALFSFAVALVDEEADAHGQRRHHYGSSHSQQLLPSTATARPGDTNNQLNSAPARACQRGERKSKLAQICMVKVFHCHFPYLGQG